MRHATRVVPLALSLVLLCVLASGQLSTLLLIIGSAEAAVDSPAVPPTRTSTPPPPLRFDAEVIRLFIRGDTLEVEGNYQLIGGPTRMNGMTLFYPYPVDSLLGGARSLFLEGRWPRRPWQPLEFAELSQRSGARWSIPIVAGDTLEVHTVYRQALRANYARYIVTTTQAWGRPITRARFEIYLPDGARPSRFSFPFERQVANGKVFYLYETDQFLPDRDIIVEWEDAATPR